MLLALCPQVFENFLLRCLFWDQEIVLKVILHFSQKTFPNSIALLKQKEKKNTPMSQNLTDYAL